MSLCQSKYLIYLSILVRYFPNTDYGNLHINSQILPKYISIELKYNGAN